jgi:capsid protein
MFERLRNFFSGDDNPVDDTPVDDTQVNISIKSGEKSLSSGNFTHSLISDLFDGEKYPGGLNSKLDFLFIDYWTLRQRSYKLFTENRYAKGLIGRLLTNEIHRGLILESTPTASILDKTDDFINSWTDDVESKFDIWADNKKLVSYDHQSNFGQIQIDIRKTALLSGDVLIVLRQHPVLRTPVIQLIDGGNVRTPIEKITDNEVRHGVEIDNFGRHKAYYIRDTKDPSEIKSIRIPANGTKSGRKIAWLVYGHKIRVGDVRGMPILGILLQALKELDRYSDAEQRAAVLNAIIPLFIKKGKDKPGTTPITGGAVRRDTVNADTGSDTGQKTYNIDKQIPGLILEDLQYGEEPVSFNTMRPNINYGVFEEAVMASFAWANEIPPTIYRLAFNSNYSASGAEINELKMYLDKIRWLQGSDVNKPIYENWLISMSLTGLIEAPELLESWRDPTKFLISGSWFSSEWSGAIKPSLRRREELAVFVKAISEGLATRDMATKAMYGRKYTTIVKRLIRENEQLGEAKEPLIESGLLRDQSSLGETDNNDDMDTN